MVDRRPVGLVAHCRQSGRRIRAESGPEQQCCGCGGSHQVTDDPSALDDDEHERHCKKHKGLDGDGAADEPCRFHGLSVRERQHAVQQERDGDTVFRVAPA
jgi:hypothetical protein